MGSITLTAAPPSTGRVLHRVPTVAVRVRIGRKFHPRITVRPGLPPKESWLVGRHDRTKG